MKRYYDFNVYSDAKIGEKLHYMHENPVVRGLVQRPERWRWSSFGFYASGEGGTVNVNDWSWWEERIRSSAVSQ
jgi:putative transposase